EGEPVAVAEALRGRRRRLASASLPPAHPGTQPQPRNHPQHPSPCHPRSLHSHPALAPLLWLGDLRTTARESISRRGSQVPDCRPVPPQAARAVFLTRTPPRRDDGVTAGNHHVGPAVDWTTDRPHPKGGRGRGNRRPPAPAALVPRLHRRPPCRWSRRPRSPARPIMRCVVPGERGGGLVDTPDGMGGRG